MRNRNEDAYPYYDDDAEVKDGETVSVRLDMMDAMQRSIFNVDADNHRPGYARMTDADVMQRRSAYQNYKRQLSDAWRSPPNAFAPQAASPPPYSDLRSAAGSYDNARGSSGTDDRQAAYDAYVERTCNAWRDAGRTATAAPTPSKLDPRAANVVEAQQQAWQGADPAQLARDLERSRNATYRDYVARLENAWRSSGR